MKRTGILLLILALGGGVAVNAKRPMTATVDVDPKPVQTGEPLSIISTLTNNTDDVQPLAASVQMRGPCGVAASRGYTVLLKGRQSDTSKASFRAPVCPGAYQATLTVSDHDGAVLGRSSVNFKVLPKEMAAGSK